MKKLLGILTICLLILISVIIVFSIYTSYILNKNHNKLERIVKFCKERGGSVYKKYNKIMFQEIEGIDGLRFDKKISKEDFEDLYLIYPDLRYIELISLNLTDSDVKLLTKFKQLESVNLQGNTDLTDESIKLLGKLKNLKYLNIGATQVKGHGFSEFEKNEGLSSLLVSRTNLDNIGMKLVSEKFPNLTYLAAGATKINDEGVKYLKSLPLVSLFLNKTNISDDGCKAIPLNDLELLVLSETLITNESLKILSFAKKLKILELNNTNIDSLSNMKSMGNLVTLWLPGTKIKDDEINNLTKLPIRQLNLSNTLVSDLSILYLTHMHDLKYLILDEYQFTKESMEKISKLGIQVNEHK